MKKLLPIFIALTLATSANAFQLADPNDFILPKSKISQFFSKVWECKWHISCYTKFGAFTEISSTNNINAFPTTYNANLAKTIEVGTTSVASITTLSNLTSVGAITSLNSLTSASSLATVGTITSGTWSGTAIAVGKGGTGTTSPSTYQVLLGNGANGLTVASSTGTSGQFLTSNGTGAYPSWQTSSVNQAANYSWTGTHSFAATTTLATTTVTNLISKNFGGTGRDGVLSISSGTTTINAANTSIITKEYTSISITGTASLAISNPAQAGTTLFLKSQGDVTITSSNIGIYLVGAGAAGVTSNANGTYASTTSASDTDSSGVGTSNGTGATGGVIYTNKNLYTPMSPTRVARKTYILATGSSGGGGNSSGSTSGAGGGVLILEVGGYLNFTGKINVSGQDGAAATGASAPRGGNGGGSSGMALILYNNLTENSGIITAAGGGGGAGGGIEDNSNAGGGGSGAGAFGAAGGNGGAGGSAAGGDGGNAGGGGGGGASCSASAGSNGSNGVNGAGGAGGAEAASNPQCYLIIQNQWF